MGDGGGGGDVDGGDVDDDDDDVDDDDDDHHDHHAEKVDDDEECPNLVAVKDMIQCVRYAAYASASCFNTFLISCIFRKYQLLAREAERNQSAGRKSKKRCVKLKKSFKGLISAVDVRACVRILLSLSYTACEFRMIRM